MKNLTTVEQRKAIQELIQDELLKRGFTAPIKTFEETECRRSGNRLEFETENFQTTPVIFKEIVVNDFNTSLSQETKKNSSDQEYLETNFWMTIHVSYRHFDGGTNGCNLFQISGKFFNDNDRPQYEIR
jgi:hypothetical protein